MNKYKINKIKKSFYISHFWGFFVSINMTSFMFTMLNVDIMKLYSGNVLAFILICIGFGLKCFMDCWVNHNKAVDCSDMKKEFSHGN